MAKPPAPPVSLTCAHCGAAFERKHWEIKAGRPVFCGRVCVNASRVGVAPVCSMPSSREDRVCQACGVTFSVPLAYIRKGAGKNCSPACANISRRQTVRRACQMCGAAFMSKPSIVAVGRGLFCSTPCSNKSRVGVTPTTKTGTPNRFGEPKKSGPPPVHMPKDRFFCDVGTSGIRVCERCQRVRELGKHCACERPMQEAV